MKYYSTTQRFLLKSSVSDLSVSRMPYDYNKNKYRQKYKSRLISTRNSIEAVKTTIFSLIKFEIINCACGFSQRNLCDMCLLIIV